MKIKDMTIIAIYASLITVIEFAMSFLPNIQITTLLIFVFCKLYNFKKSAIMIIVYVTLDNLVMGTFSILYYPPALVAWLTIPVIFIIIKSNNTICLALIGFIFGFYYGMMYVPSRMFEYGINDIIPYIISDIPFQIIMAVTNFVTIYLLYEVLYKNFEIHLRNDKI